MNIEAYLRQALANPKSQSKLALEISGKCVCNCFHCYADILKKYPDMTEQEAGDILHNARAIGFDKVYIVGGEPMLHPDIVNICKNSHELGFFTILVTNGYRLDDLENIKKIAPFIDQFEISVRSNDPSVHNRIISGKGINDTFIPDNEIKGSHQKALIALMNLTKAKKQHGFDYKIIINHDLYTPQQGSSHIVYNIARQIYAAGGILDGFYTQIMAVAGRAKQNLDKFEIFKISEGTLFEALEDLGRLEAEFGIKDLRLVDDPVGLGILGSIEDIPQKYHKYLITEYIPAICTGGYKPNVIEEVIYENNI